MSADGNRGGVALVATGIAVLAAAAGVVGGLTPWPLPLAGALVALVTAAAVFGASVLPRSPLCRRSGGGAPEPDAVTELVARVRAEAEAMTSSIEQLSAEANSIAFNSMMQAGASETARESLSEMSTSITRVSALAEETEARSQRVSELAAEGESQAQAAAAAMEALSTAMAGIEQRVRPLLAHANEIGTSAQLIHRIASQTKLLSLNATIEAVRAGDRGAGFAVVAEEVRKLADASSTASLEITAAVTAIQEGSAAVAEGIDAASVVVHVGVEHVGRTYELLAPIRREADDTLERNREVVGAVGAEADLTGTAVEAMGQVLEVASQTDTVVNQALETSTAMSQSTDAILQAIAPWQPGPGSPDDPAEEGGAVGDAARTAEFGAVPG